MLQLYIIYDVWSFPACSVDVFRAFSQSLILSLESFHGGSINLCEANVVSPSPFPATSPPGGGVVILLRRKRGGGQLNIPPPPPLLRRPSPEAGLIPAG